MSKHLSEIQLFEFANELIINEAELLTIKEHLTICEECALLVKKEKELAKTTIDAIEIKDQVDVSEKVLSFFNQPKVNVIGVDVKWVSIMLVVISSLMLMGDLTLLNKSIPAFSYTTLIASAISAVLLVEFLVKYWKYRKETTA